jgi:hypothetical protein
MKGGYTKAVRMTLTRGLSSVCPNNHELRTMRGGCHYIVSRLCRDYSSIYQTPEKSGDQREVLASWPAEECSADAGSPLW